MIFLFLGEHGGYEDCQYKVRIFLNSECSLFARFLTFFESVDRENNMEDVQNYASSEDFPGWPVDVTRMCRQLFNVLAQKTRGNSFQTVITCQRKKCVAVLELESNCCVLTKARMQAGVRHSPSEHMTSSVCHRTQKYLPAWNVGSRIEGTR